jgi:hypothetical protein
MKARAQRKALMRTGDVVVVQLGPAAERATVVRDESPGRPVVLRTDSGRMMTAFPAALTRVER